MLMTTLYVPAFSPSKEYMPVVSVVPDQGFVGAHGPWRISGNESERARTGSPSVCMLSTVTSSAKSTPLTDAVVVCSPAKSTISAFLVTEILDIDLDMTSKMYASSSGFSIETVVVAAGETGEVVLPVAVGHHLVFTLVAVAA